MSRESILLPELQNRNNGCSGRPFRSFFTGSDKQAAKMCQLHMAKPDDDEAPISGQAAAHYLALFRKGAREFLSADSSRVATNRQQRVVPKLV